MKYDLEYLEKHSKEIIERNIQGIKDMIDVKHDVLKQFQPLFSEKGIDELTQTQFKEFLLFKNNRHWTGLHRQGNKICSNMSSLKKALKILVNEELVIEERLDKLRPKDGNHLIPYLGKAVITAVLQISFPDKYGVWNDTTEKALKYLKLHPNFDRGESFGSKYCKINEVLSDIAIRLNVDFWTLDTFWWIITDEKQKIDELISEEEEEEDQIEEGKYVKSFGLEKHLENFLINNWETLEIGKKWKILDNEGDLVGVQYDAKEAGIIDILAKNEEENKWLIIELKRGKAGTKVIGQIQAYMGWIKKHLANVDEKIEGLIIAHNFDDKLVYALEYSQNIRFQKYNVDFELIDYKFS